MRHVPRVLGALAAVVAVAAVTSWLSPSTETEDTALPVGARLPVPLEIDLPEGAVAVADDLAVGIDLPRAEAEVLVTVPRQVALPDGSRTLMPVDPAQWLRVHPAINVTRTRYLTVSGRWSVQVDYRTAASYVPGDVPLPLFCGWRPGPDPKLPPLAGSPCTQLLPGERVRATFVPAGDAVVLVEARWASSIAMWARTPARVRRDYTAVLDGIRVQGDPEPVAGGGWADPPWPER